jgi:hypothetical protein
MKYTLFGFALTTSILISVIPFPAKGQIGEKAIMAGKFKIESQFGYIYLHGSRRTFGTFLKTPDESDIAQYEKDWEIAFEKAKQKYLKDLKKYQARLKIWELDNKKIVNQGDRSDKPPSPIEPSRDSFMIDDIELRNSAQYGPKFVYTNDKNLGTYSYLILVKPGTYTYHGQIAPGNQSGFFGTCFCMGSIQFDVKPGIITDIGNFPDNIYPINDHIAAVNSDSGSMAPNFGFGLPDSLKAFPSVTADFSAAGKSGNYFGVVVNRLPAIPGILAYDRDKVIDLKSAPSAH